MYVSMHQIDEEFMASHAQRVKMATDSLQEVLVAARSRPQSLGILSRSAHSAGAYCYLNAPKSEEVSRALQLSRQALNALFACAVETTGATVAPLGPGNPVTFTDKPPASSVNASNWLDGFFLNLIFGDLEALRRLCAIPTSLLRESPTKSSENRYLFKDALCAYVNQQPELIARIIDALKATDPETPDRDELAATLALWVPQLEVFLYVATGDAKFGPAMQQAVEKHRRFWSRSPDSARHFKGIISLELLGLLVLARDVGLDSEVETPYLPISLIQAM